jgi:hypothetical protein
MQEIQIVADINIVKYIVLGISGLVGIINVLAGIILRDMKKSITDIKKMQREDHDLLMMINTEHDIYHPKS